jgi:proteic killer suppression protein
MEVDFDEPDLQRLETDSRFDAGFQAAIVRGYRKAMFAIRQAVDERDLYVHRGLRFERLKGQRDHQCSMRVNNQWRLILEIDERTQPHKIKVIGIEDYH